MTDLSATVAKAWERIRPRASEHPLPAKVYFDAGVSAAREYSKQREEKGHIGELLSELAEDAMNPVFEDSRVNYVEIQIDRDTWEKLKRLYEESKEGSVDA